MDTSAKDIVFGEGGVCSFCTELLARSGELLTQDAGVKQERLRRFVEAVKSGGRGKPYDCIVGVSGGVDSSWVLVQAVQLGLRPLAVHMDNGWNSELAQNNIAKLVESLNVDLYTHVIDWHEYKGLMQAFFDADVIDVELLYDNAMLAVNYKLAAKYGLRYILSGSNQATEGMRMPNGWNWLKYDKRNIRKLARRFGNIKMSTFPSIGTFDYIWYRLARKIQWTSILDMMEFNKAVAMQQLQEKYGYKPYPYKHYESVFTRFYQGYILPEKFSVDKRRLHFSSLIISGQMGREDAILKLAEMPYASEAELEQDRDYFMKKMGWDESKMKDYLSRPARSHEIYGSERKLWFFSLGFYHWLKGV